MLVFPCLSKGSVGQEEGKLTVECSQEDLSVVSGNTALPPDFSKALRCKFMDLIDIFPDLHNSKQYVSTTVS